MTTFKFNFTLDSDDSKPTEENPFVEYELSIQKPSREIIPKDECIKNIDELVVKANMFTFDDIEIGYVYSDDVINYLKNEDEEININQNIVLSEYLHTDLLEGKYEGGLKIWECTIDLVEYIHNNDTFEFENSTVLDLGCGMGIIGILCLLRGATVHFQDYNDEVIIGATIPNVLLNLPESDRINIKKRCKFYSGDWASFNDLLDDIKYNYIFTSETIYNTKNYKKIYNIIKKHLQQSGSAFVAAKSHYFGVGGSIKEFVNCIKTDNNMSCEVCYTKTNGIQREILKLSLKN